MKVLLTSILKAMPVVLASVHGLQIPMLAGSGSRAYSFEACVVHQKQRLRQRISTSNLASTSFRAKAGEATRVV